MDPQLKRGMLEACALAVLARGDSYGYQMVRDVGAHVEVSESTLYPILRRLEAGGYLRVYSREHNGRLRKYYGITEEGRAHLHILKNCAGNGGRCWTYMPSSWKGRRERDEKGSVPAGA